MVIQVTGTDPTAVTCQVITMLFIRHLFSKDIKNQATGAKTIQSLRHEMTLTQEIEINLKSLKG